MMQKLLDLAAIGKDRLHLAWVSSAEAQRFVDVATEVTQSIREQGRYDVDAHKPQLDAVENTLTGEVIRWLVGKEIQLTTKGDVYGRPWDVDTFEKILDTSLEREYQKNLILEAVKDGCTSPRDIRGRIGLDLKRISYLLADLEKTNKVEFKHMQECKPVFAAL
jgi:predicted transcriptional regulator